MTRTLRVCALQLTAHTRNEFETGGVSLGDIVEDAARDHDLVVLPEGTFPAYVLGDDHVDHAAITRALDELASIARRHACVIVAGSAIVRAGRLYNSAVVIDGDGSIAGSAEKIFLWHFDRKWFAPGTSLAPIRTAAGNLGVLICADGRMPTISQTLVDRGAEILVMPTAWVTSGRNPDVLENIQADLLARVRAFENGVPFVAANKCGVEQQMVAYCGKSQIIDASGTVVALASQQQAGRVSAELIVGGAHAHRAHVPKLSPDTPPTGSTRIAFSIDPAPADTARRLEILDDTELLTPQSNECIDARIAYDPAALPQYRASGRRRIVLVADTSDAWLESIARARAAELRLYVFVFDRASDRAYAVDPDGTIVAGTTGSLRIASVAVDYRRTNETDVAPGTNVEQGLAAVASIAAEARV